MLAKTSPKRGFIFLEFFASTQNSQLLPFSLIFGKGVGRTWLFPYLGGEIAAEFEFFQCQGHGVGAEEEDEGHEGQVGHEFAGFSH